MSAQSTLFHSDIKSLRLIRRGKVRDIYDIGEESLLIITTDRLSAFDVVLPDPIPGKGAVLTAVSNFWFDKIRHISPNHLSPMTLEEALPDPDERAQVQGRATVAWKLTPLPVEAIVRGYLIGSGWKEYRENSSVCGIKLPSGLRQADKLPQSIFTPSTKAENGEHDENISLTETIALLGENVAIRVREASLRIYKYAAEYALERGIIIADTKFEFALDSTGNLILIDEVLTPDSSRFWPADSYSPGISPPSFDKQFVRDYLETLRWDKTPPAPELPPDIIAKTAAKYLEAQHRLMDRHRVKSELEYTER